MPGARWLPDATLNYAAQGLVVQLAAYTWLSENSDPAGSPVPQDVQLRQKAAPHSRQNFESAGFSCWHR